MARATEIMERKKAEKEAEMRRLRKERAERDRIRFGSASTGGVGSTWWKPGESIADKEIGRTVGKQEETSKAEDKGSRRSRGGT